MNIKRVTAGFCILAGAAALVIGCAKPTPNVAPEPDTETTSALDAVWMLQSITDIDMIVSYLGENQFLTNSYIEVKEAGVPNGSTTAQRDTTHGEPQLVMSFNNTRCVDGILRDGSVFLYYGSSNTNPNKTANSKYIREYGFGGSFYLSQYLVDKWKIETDQGHEAVDYNTLPTDKYDITSTQMSWYVGGKFLFTPPNGSSSQPMICEVRLKKTLTNSTDKKVLASKASAITWSNAVISYTGTANGITSDGKAFTMTLTPERPLVRDWTCSPDKIGNVVQTPTPGVLAQRLEEYHPFVKGIATFIPEGKYPRQIYFGNEGDTTLSWQCDRVGEILIKGNSYKVDFRKNN